MEENLSDERKTSATSRKEGSPYRFSEFSLVAGILCFIVVNLIYAENKVDFETSGESTFFPDVTLLLLVLGATFMIVSVASFLSVESKRTTTIDSQLKVKWSVGAIIAETLSDKKFLIAGVSAVYGFIFAFLDGVLIYQPNVDFTVAYGFSAPASVVENCCGPPGYIPAGLVYFPAQHLGIQLIPASLMIMVLISVLVGLNVALLIASVEKSRMGKSVSGVKSSPVFGGAFGAVLGVFAGCPTCAAVFFLSMIAGSGATAFSIAISEFQPVIILVSIPLLVASILWQARSIGKILQGCPA